MVRFYSLFRTGQFGSRQSSLQQFAKPLRLLQAILLQVSKGKSDDRHFRA